jgi:hypothetical protein
MEYNKMSKPGVIKYVLIYYGVIVLMQLAAIVMMILFIFEIIPSGAVTKSDVLAKNLTLGLTTGAFMISIILYLIAAFLLVNNKGRLSFYYNLCFIVLGIDSIMIIPAIILTIKWLKPEVKSYFNMS